MANSCSSVSTRGFLCPALPAPRPKEGSVYAQDLAATIPADEDPVLRADLAKLSGWVVQQVVADEHSLFRAISHHILDRQVLDGLSSRADSLQSLLPPSKLKKIEQKASALEKRIREWADVNSSDPGLASRVGDPADGSLPPKKRRLHEVASPVEMSIGPKMDSLAEMKRQIARQRTFLLYLRDHPLEAEVRVADLFAQAKKKLDQGMKPREILDDSETSTRWILFLRRLSVGWWKKTCTECAPEKRKLIKQFSFLSMTDEPLGFKVRRYAKEIGSLTKALPGGFLEAAAISNALGIIIRPVDLDFLDEKKRSFEPPAIVPGERYLLGDLIADHYDVLYPPNNIPRDVLEEMNDTRRSFLSYTLLQHPSLSRPMCYENKSYAVERCKDPWADPALLSRPLAIEECAKAFPPGDSRKEDLLMLEGFSLQKVAKDGHCLFSSISALLMTLPIIDKLVDQAESLQSITSFEGSLRNLFVETQRLLREGRTPGEILMSPAGLSRQWVSFLRLLAVNHWMKEFRTNPNSDSIRSFIAGERSSRRLPSGTDDETIMAEYVSKMGVYSKAAWGGQIEALAIERALKIPLFTINLDGLRISRSDEILRARQIPSARFLLYSNNPPHFDALYAARS